MAQSIFNQTGSGTIKNMSFYRVSDAPPDWAQQDASQPDYIANKDLAEKLRRILVNGVEVLDDSHESGPLNFVAGTNIVITAEGNTITFSSTGGGASTEQIIALAELIETEHNRAIEEEEKIAKAVEETNKVLGSLQSIVNNHTTVIDSTSQLIVGINSKLDIGEETVASYVAKEIEKVNTFGAPVATEEIYGVVKLSKQIGVDEEGGLRIKQITTDDIVQGESMWVLNGGDESVIPN